MSADMSVTPLKNHVGSGQQVVTGDGAARRIVFGDASNNTLNGGTGIDRLYGGSGSDNLWGGAGNDYLEGGNDADTLYGEAGDDTLYGGAGNDVLTTGSGRDALLGGQGHDTYWISNDARSAIITDSDGAGSVVIENADGSFYARDTAYEGDSACAA